MMFERPLFLLLLAGALLLWWLRVRPVRRDVVVASVTPFRGASAEAAQPTPRRRADPLLLLAIVGAVSLALAAAGPRVGRPDADRILVLHGRFEALGAGLAQPPRDASSGVIATGRDSAEALVRAWLRDAAPNAVLEEVSLDVPDAEFPRAALEALRARSLRAAIVVADHNIAGPFVVAMPQSAALPDLGISAIVYDGTVLGDKSATDRGRILVTIASSEVTAVAVAVRCEDQEARALVPARGQVDVAMELSLASLLAGVSVVLEPGGSLAVGDRVQATIRGGVRSVAIVDAPGTTIDHREIQSVLSAAGIREVLADGEPDVVVRLGGDPAWRAPQFDRPSDRTGVLVFAPTVSDGADDRGDIRAVLSGTRALLHGSDITGHALPAGIDVPLPGPGTTLLAATRLVGGSPWMSDRAGVLVAASPRRVVLALDPSPARTAGGNGGVIADFTSDPAFAALTLAALDHAVGGPARVVADGLRPARGGWLDGLTAVTVTDDAVRSAVERTASEPNPVSTTLETLLTILGAASVVACAVIPVLRARRPVAVPFRVPSPGPSSKGPPPRG